MEDHLRDVWDLANKNNVAIYAVDPRGLATNEFGIDQNINNTTDSTYLRSTMDTLRTLALNTDGRAIVNRNDLTLGMKQIIRDTSALLPARLQLDVHCDRRQVPRDQGEGEPSRHPGPRAKRLLGVYGRRCGAGARAAEAPKPRRRWTPR